MTSFGLSTLVDSDGDGIMDLRTPNVGQGITAGIIGGNDFSIPALLAMIETEQDSNVLNVPSVLVNNNAVARVSQLTEQPTTQITAVEAASAGQTETSPGTRRRGSRWRSPLIWRAALPAPERLPRGLLHRRRERRDRPSASADDPDLVNVPDGATMVVGGIVIDNEANTANQVRGSGIPLLGRVFQRDTKSKGGRSSTSSSPASSRTRTSPTAESRSARSSSLEVIGLDKVQRWTDNGVDAETGSPVSLEGFDLPLYTPPARGETDEENVGIAFEASCVTTTTTTRP